MSKSSVVGPRGNGLVLEEFTHFKPRSYVPSPPTNNDNNDNIDVKGLFLSIKEGSRVKELEGEDVD